MNAVERIRAAREARTPTVEHLQAHRAEATPHEPTNSMRSAPALAASLDHTSPTRPATPANPTPDAENWRNTQQQLAALRVAIEQSRRETNRTLWVVAITCILAGASVGPLARAMAPTVSSESLRLEELGANVEERYWAMTAKERTQVDKLMGWTRETGRRAR